MTDLTDIHLKVGEGEWDEKLRQQASSISQFRVFARLRPFISEELQRLGNGPLSSAVEMKGDSTYPLDPENKYRPSHEFVFDRSLWSIPPTQKLQKTSYFYDNKHEECVDQAEMYTIATTDDQGLSMVDNAFMGINSCVLTYGQTSSGKTYTMMGRYGEGADPKDRGIIPRVCDELFEKVRQRREQEAKKPEAERWELIVTVTFVEIYLEKVRDLLDPNLRGKHAVRATTTAGARSEADMKEALAAMKEAKVRLHPEHGRYVEGIEHVKVNSWADCQKVLERGSAHRTTAVTSVHDNSSRSHAIFSVTLLQRRKVGETREGTNYEKKRAVLNLVDLAGSERGGGTAYVHESAAINKSLMALRRVIDNLSDRQRMQYEIQAAELAGKAPPKVSLPHVPYNDSVLTQLLQDSIGGNSKTVMISNMTPSPEFYEETLRTLEWSFKAKGLTNFVHREVDTGGMVKGQLDEQIGKMGQDFANARRHFNNLSEELEHRQQVIDKLTQKNAECQKRIADLKVKFDLSKEQRAATMLQLAFYLYTFRKQRAVRREEVRVAEAAASAARAELRSLEDQHDDLLTSLLRLHIIMNRLAKRAAEVGESCDATIEDAQSKKQRQPEDLRAELEGKRSDLKAQREELEALKREQEEAQKLAEKYHEDKERHETRVENELLDGENAAAEEKLAILEDVFGAGSDSAFAQFLVKDVDLGGQQIQLFEQNADGKWAPSGELEKRLKAIEEEKAAADKRKAEAEAEKKEKLGKRDGLRGEVASERSKAEGLSKQIEGVKRNIEEEKKKCC